jgi:CheY-like chemotaxis protein
MDRIEKLADIVVVDEDDQTRRASEAWMRREGYEAAVCVPSAQAAVRFLDAYRPKFAVIDVTTLGPDGLDVLERIRREPRLKNLAAVVHVAVPETGEREFVWADDATAFRSQAYLTNGINWPGMRAEAEKYVQ